MQSRDRLEFRLLNAMSEAVQQAFGLLRDMSDEELEDFLNKVDKKQIHLIIDALEFEFVMPEIIDGKEEIT